MAEREKLDRKDARKLVRAAYGVSFPYLLLFIGLMLITLWLLTEVVFR